MREADLVGRDFVIFAFPFPTIRVSKKKAKMRSELLYILLPRVPQIPHTQGTSSMKRWLQAQRRNLKTWLGLQSRCRKRTKPTRAHVSNNINMDWYIPDNELQNSSLVVEDFIADIGCLRSLRWLESIRVRTSSRRRDSTRDEPPVAVFVSQTEIEVNHRSQDKGAATNSRGLFIG
jgi:hypothetical protein